MSAFVAFWPLLDDNNAIQQDFRAVERGHRVGGRPLASRLRQLRGDERPAGSALGDSRPKCRPPMEAIRRQGHNERRDATSRGA